MLKSPRFLYREVGAVAPDGHELAARLSYTLWDSLPDAALREAADKGQLTSREQVSAQAERMIGNLRARSKIRAFLMQWLKVESVPELSKDPEHYPGFDASVASDLRSSLDLMLDEVVWGDSSDFRQLLLSDSVFLNGRLAQFYGVDLPADAPFQKVSPGAGERAGILTHPYLLSYFAYTATTSPIHRGVFVARSVLGRSLRPPPVAVAPLAPDLHADLTTRERVTLQTSPEACQTCHVMINALGFSLETYDAVGRYRAEERNKPIDANGSYQTEEGDTVTFQGARQMAAFLADSPEVHESFAEQFFHVMVKQPILAYSAEARARLRTGFAENGFSIRKLATAIAVEAAMPTTTGDVAVISDSTVYP